MMHHGLAATLRILGEQGVPIGTAIRMVGQAESRPDHMSAQANGLCVHQWKSDIVTSRYQIFRVL